jgi:hypothetical protein
MDFVSSISAFSNILNIKDKLFPQDKEDNSTEIVEFNIKNYCSIFLQHYRNSFKSEDDKVELILSKKSNFTVPIRHLDWVFLERKLDSIQVDGDKIPELLLIDATGFLYNINPENILRSQIQFLNLSGKQLKKALKTIELQCTYADGYKQKVNVPESLIESLIQKYGV